MKFTKKILAIVLVVGMIFSFAAMSFATPTYAVKAGTVDDNYVTVSFIAKNATGFTSNQTPVTYDKNILSVASITDGPYKTQYTKCGKQVMSCYNKSTAGTIIPGIILADKIYSDTTFAKLVKSKNQTFTPVKTAELVLFTVKFKVNTKSSATTTTVKWGSSSAKITLKLTAAAALNKVVNQNGSVKFTWSKQTGASSYYIYRKAGSAKTWTKIATTKTTSYVDKSVKSGTTYKYTVAGVCNGKVSTKKNETGLSITYLTQPTLKSITSAKAGVTVNWTKVTGATGYCVYRRTGSTGKLTRIATVKGGTNITYLDKTAKKGITYKYYVKAYKGNSISAYDTKGLTIKDKY